MPAIIGVIGIIIATIGGVISAYIGRPEGEIVFVTATLSTPASLTGTPAISSTLQVTPISISPNSGATSSFGLAIALSLVSFFITAMVIVFYYRKLSSISISRPYNDNGIINLHNIESYLEKRIQISLVGNDNDLSLTQDTVLLENYELQKEKLLLEGISPYLIDMLGDGTKDSLCQEIVNILDELKIVDAEPKIIDLLTRPNPNLQIACVKALGEFRTKHGSKVLQKIIRNPGNWHKDVVSHSIIAIKKMNPPNYLDTLVKLLNHNDVAEETKNSYIIPSLEELNTDKARFYIKAYEISKMEDENLESVLRRISNKV